ncbi:MAG: YkgJ family cysteine cluster protein [Flavobacteriales bacterium]|nr:YkgJ family cysteine cluster protein [Flavobacteriales bacterium]
MNSDYRKYLERAESEGKSIKKTFARWKRKTPNKLDDHFQEAHYEAFEEIECLDCANCCKTTSPIFIDRDIDRIASHLRMKPSAFIEKYLRLDSDDDYVLQRSPCAFLGPDNYCSIYDFRPRACREYPHTDRKNMHQILDLTRKNTEVCPAVARIVLQLKSYL